MSGKQLCCAGSTHFWPDNVPCSTLTSKCTSILPCRSMASVHANPGLLVCFCVESGVSHVDVDLPNKRVVVSSVLPSSRVQSLLESKGLSVLIRGQGPVSAASVGKIASFLW